MKLLQVIASVDLRGGGPIEGVFASSEVWHRHGHQRHIVCLDAASAPWVASATTPTAAVGLDGPVYGWLRRWVPWLRYGYAPGLKSWLEAHADEYDAIVVNGLWNYASFGAWRGLRNSKTPYFVFTHGMLDPWFNTAYPLKTIFKRIFWRLFEHRVLRDAEGVLFTCEEERRLASQSFSPYQANEIVVGYGTRDILGDPARQVEAFYSAMPQMRGRRFALFLSRIHEKKGVDLLIEAFARLADQHPDWDLVIAGPDQNGLKARLIAMARDLKVESRIHWPGMLTGDAKWGAFRASQFFVLPSHQENFGIVVAEAMALHKPVLLTNKVQIWREVEGDGAGVAVNDDVDGVQRGLSRLLTMPEAERAGMGEAARRSFAARYDLEQNAMSLLDLFRAAKPRV